MSDLPRVGRATDVASRLCRQDSYEQGLDLITRVEEFRSRGAKFLLLPITHLWWLDRHPQFKQHLEASYRVAARTTDCVVFSLRWPTDADFRNTGVSDGFALPPPELMQLTVAYDNSEIFFRSGQQGAEWIESILDEHGIQVVSLKAMLDYGCGCGRIIRHWGRYPEVHVVGVDYNPRLTDWCRTHLRFADFETPLAANLAFESEYFESDLRGFRVHAPRRGRSSRLPNAADTPTATRGGISSSRFMAQRGSRK